jgi:hypothetical protein
MESVKVDLRIEIEQNNNDRYLFRHQPNFYLGANTIRPTNTTIVDALYKLLKEISAYFFKLC